MTSVSSVLWHRVWRLWLQTITRYSTRVTRKIFARFQSLLRSSIIYGWNKELLDSALVCEVTIANIIIIIGTIAPYSLEEKAAIVPQHFLEQNTLLQQMKWTRAGGISMWLVCRGICPDDVKQCYPASTPNWTRTPCQDSKTIATWNIVSYVWFHLSTIRLWEFSKTC